MPRTERIAAIEVGEDGGLRLTPAETDFKYIYRAAMGVRWREESRTLYFPDPPEEDYLRQFQRILAACEDEYGVRLTLDAGAEWISVPGQAKRSIEEKFVSGHDGETTMTNIAFIGLGNMGGPMAANLVKAGYAVTATDLSIAAVDRAAAAGCKRGETVADAVKDADVVVSMLPAGAHVRSVYTDQYGVVANAKEGALFIDSSTIDVDSARAVTAAAAEKGFAMVDAPVSGGVAAAIAGALTFMVGGESDAFARAKPVLEGMGKNIFHAGRAGNGQVAKIANNMLLGVTMIGTCEAFNLAEKLGLDAQTFFDISSTASGQSWSMTSYCPAPGPVPAAPANRDYQPGFTAAMMLKDMRLAQEAAHKAKAATPLGAQAEALYALMEAAGKDDLDFSGVMKLIKGAL